MSEPAPGSVMPSAHTVSPWTMPGRYFRFWASVPKRTSQGDDMSVWTSTLKATPPERQRASSSPSTTLEKKSPPAPPYSAGKSRPRKPELAETAPERLGDLARLFPGRHLGRHLPLHEAADALAEHLVLGGEWPAGHRAWLARARSRSSCRSSVRRILPEMVFGRSVTNSISRGYLYGAVTCLT